MKKTSLLLALFLLSVGFVTAQQDFVNSTNLENNVKDEQFESNEKAKTEEEEDQGVKDSPEKGKPVLPDLSPEEAFKEFNKMMRNRVSRRHILDINRKMKHLFLENNNTKELQNIMKNVNFLHTHPEFTELTEEAFGSWNKVVQNGFLQEFVKNVMEKKEELEKEENMVKTVHVVKKALLDVHENANAQILIRAGIRTVHKLMQQRAMVVGILTDALRIVEDRRKLSFILDVGFKVAPLCHNIMELLALEPQPEPSLQPAQAPQGNQNQKPHGKKKFVLKRTR